MKTTWMWLVALALLLAAPCKAQSVSPLNTECGHKCNSEFTVSNAGLEQLFVSVQPYSFSLTKKGDPIFRPLDKTVTVQLNEMSSRVGPKSEHTFGYKIQCEQYPCQVVLMASMMMGHHTDTGVGVRLQLAHVIYICDRAKDCRANSRQAAGIVN